MSYKTETVTVRLYYKDLKTLKHALQLRIQREDISEKDRLYEAELIERMKDLELFITRCKGCGCHK